VLSISLSLSLSPHFNKRVFDFNLLDCVASGWKVIAVAKVENQELKSNYVHHNQRGHLLRARGTIRVAGIRLERKPLFNADADATANGT
jgi:hypothetical protein